MASNDGRPIVTPATLLYIIPFLFSLSESLLVSASLFHPPTPPSIYNIYPERKNKRGIKGKREYIRKKNKIKCDTQKKYTYRRFYIVRWERNRSAKPRGLYNVHTERERVVVIHSPRTYRMISYHPHQSSSTSSQRREKREKIIYKYKENVIIYPPTLYFPRPSTTFYISLPTTGKKILWRVIDTRPYIYISNALYWPNNTDTLLQ